MKKLLLAVFFLLLINLFLNFLIIFHKDLSKFFQPAQISEPLKDQEKKEKTEEVFLKIENQIKDLQKSLAKINNSLQKIDSSFQKILKKEKLQEKKTTFLQDSFLELKEKIENLGQEDKEIQKNFAFLREEIENLSFLFQEEFLALRNLKELALKNFKEDREEIGQPKNLLISEVSAGFDSAKNEFIEIYNPNDFPIEINSENFILEIVNSKNQKTQKRIEWRRNIVLPKGYFLFVAGQLQSQGQKIEGDAYFSPQLTSIGGVIIKNKKGEILDRIAWGREGEPFPIEATEFRAKLKKDGLRTGESLKRKIQKAEMIDTDNNQADFEFSSILTPQNSLGEKLVYAKNLFPEKPKKETADKRTSPRKTSKEAKILISQVQIQEEEFIQLFNPNPEPVSLQGKYILYFSQKRLITNPYRVWKIEENFVIRPKSFFTIGIYLKENSSLKTDWQILTKEKKPYSRGQMAKDGAIGIFQCHPKEKENCQIDLVGWGRAKVYETKPVAVSENTKILIRKKSESFYQDTDNNFEDFLTK